MFQNDGEFQIIKCVMCMLPCHCVLHARTCQVVTNLVVPKNRNQMTQKTIKRVLFCSPNLHFVVSLHGQDFQPNSSVCLGQLSLEKVCLATGLPLAWIWIHKELGVALFLFRPHSTNFQKPLRMVCTLTLAIIVLYCIIHS